MNFKRIIMCNFFNTCITAGLWTFNMYCCVEGCWKGKGKRHTFPKPIPCNQVLFKQWVYLCGNERLRNLSFDKIYVSYRVCSSHFSTEDMPYNRRRRAGCEPSQNLPDPLKNYIAEDPPIYVVENIEDIPSTSSTQYAGTPQKVTASKKKILRRKKYLKTRAQLARKANLDTHSILSKFTGLRKTFFASQLKHLKTKNKGQRYTIEEKVFGMSLLKQNPSGYRFMQKFFSLPSCKTLQRLLSHTDIGPGLNSGVFSVLSAELESSNKANDKFALLMFDEMAIQPHLYPNLSTGTMEGFEDFGYQRSEKMANHVQVQTGFHLAWTISGMLSYLCAGRHTNYLYVYIYITYFYRKECGKIDLDEPPSSSFSLDLTSDSVSDSEDLYRIIWDVVHNAIFADESVLVARTYTYVTLFVVLDGIWLVTATILIIGTWYNVRKYWVLVCFSPWLLTTAVMILVDVVAAVHYGLDIIKINSVTGWLKLIGVVNYNDFLYMNDYEMDSMTSVMPSVIMCTLCCRMFIFWIPNVYMFYTILSAIINVYQGDKIQRAQHQQHCRNEGTELNASAQERILRWQMYYGTISSDHNGNNTLSKSKKKKHVQVTSPAGSPVDDGPSNIRALFEMNSSVNTNICLTGALMNDSNIASTAF